MQSIKAQRMKKLIKIKGDIGNQMKEYHFKFPQDVHEIIQTNEKSIQPTELIKKDFIKKILSDEFNSWDAYMIYDVLQQIQKKQIICIHQPDNDKNVKDVDAQKNKSEQKQSIFRSVHSMQDLATLKNTKIYSKKDKPKMEKQARKMLASQPDMKLLLSEIYEQMEEAIDETQVLKKRNNSLAESRFMQDNQDFENPELQMLNELEKWAKQLKQQKKSKLTQAKISQFKSQTSLKSPSNQFERRQTTRLTTFKKKDEIIDRSKMDRSPSRSNSPAKSKEKQSENLQRMRQKLYQAFVKSKSIKSKEDYHEDRKTNQQVIKFDHYEVFRWRNT